jgi:hypothetical protein
MVSNCGQPTAYLEAYMSKKVYIVAGPKFGEREGHILVISKHCMAYAVVVEPGGMIYSPTALENLASSLVKQNLISG